MQYITFTLPFVTLLAAGVAVAQTTLTVNTPATLITCQPAALSWTGGTAPYYPRVTVGGDVASTLVTFDTTSSTTLTWTVDIAAGTSVTIDVTDSTGVSGASAEVTIAEGTTTCLSSSTTAATTATSTSASGSSSSSSSRSSSSAASSSSSSAATTSSRATTTSSAAASSTTSSAASASTSASTSGAESVRGFTAAVAGVVGIVAAALL